MCGVVDGVENCGQLLTADGAVAVLVELIESRLIDGGKFLGDLGAGESLKAVWAASHRLVRCSGSSCTQYTHYQRGSGDRLHTMPELILSEAPIMYIMSTSRRSNKPGSRLQPIPSADEDAERVTRGVSEDIERLAIVV